MRSRFWCHHTTTISCCRGFSAAIFWLCTFGCASTQCCAIQKDYSAGNSQLSLLQHYYRMYLWETKPHVFFGAVEVGKSLPSHSRRSSCCNMPRIVARNAFVSWYSDTLYQCNSAIGLRGLTSRDQGAVETRIVKPWNGHGCSVTKSCHRFFFRLRKILEPKAGTVCRKFQLRMSLEKCLGDQCI